MSTEESDDGLQFERWRFECPNGHTVRRQHLAGESYHCTNCRRAASQRTQFRRLWDKKREQFVHAREL